MTDPGNNNVAKQFTPSTIHNMESKMINNIIHDYWEFMINQIRDRGILDDVRISELTKSDLLNRFLIENNTLINNNKIEPSKMRR